jgi:hypothetical protein
MERQLRHLQNQPVTLVEIGLALIRMWNNIQQALFNTLIRTMRRRTMLMAKKRNCALLKAKLDINIKIKCIYCVQYIVK